MRYDTPTLNCEEPAKLAAELDPVGVAERRRNAEKDRHTTLRPAPDTMTRFGALLPVKDGVAIHAVLTREADRLKAAGDERTRGQIMADTLVDRVLHRGSAAAPAPDPTKWDQPAGTVFGTATSVESVETTRDDEPGLMVNVVVSDEVLLGERDGSGWVEGYGAVPGNLLREWIAERLEHDQAASEITGTESPTVWLRRLYETPQDGELVAMDSVARLFSNKLAQFLRLRDRHCRMPYCDAPIRHLDHVEEHADGGQTRHWNGQGLCAMHNHAKQALGWSARPRPGPRHTVETTTPTGHTYASAAPHAGGNRRYPEIRLDIRYLA